MSFICANPGYAASKWFLACIWCFLHHLYALIVFWINRNGQERGGKGGRGQVSAPLHTGSQAAPREETLHRGVLPDSRCERLVFARAAALITVDVSDRRFMCDFWFQGDENEPEQQSDTEEGGTKGEPQVTTHTRKTRLEPVSQIKPLSLILQSVWFAILFSSLVPFVSCHQGHGSPRLWFSLFLLSKAPLSSPPTSISFSLSATFDFCFVFPFPSSGDCFFGGLASRTCAQPQISRFSKHACAQRKGSLFGF